jgi:hypothetical protein
MKSALRLPVGLARFGQGCPVKRVAAGGQLRHG